MLFQVNLSLILYVLTLLPPPCNHLQDTLQGWSSDSASVLDHEHGLGLLLLGRIMPVSEERLFSCLVPAVLSV